MQQSDLYGQQPLPLTVSRELDLVELTQTAPRIILRTGRMGEQLRLQLDLDTVEDDELYGMERHIHLRLMSKFDHWNTDHLAKWLVKEFKGKWSERTIYRALKGLRQKRYLVRTARKIPTLEKTVWRRGYQVFEVPPPAPEGYDPDAVVVVTGRKYCDWNTRPPDYKKRVFGTMDGGRKARKTSDKARTPDCQICHTNKGWSVPHTSEHVKTDPLSLGRESGFLDVLRVLTDECQSAETVDGAQRPEDRPDTTPGSAAPATARRAKRQKGRSAPAKPHNSRKTMRRNRHQINTLQIRPKADSAEFMANLTASSLDAAIQSIHDLPRVGSDEWVTAVAENPLLAVLFDNLGLKVWGAQSLRRTLRLFLDRLPVADMLLYWIAERTGQWSGNIPDDMRSRFDRDHPTKPDIRREAMHPDVIWHLHTWQERMDTCREWLIEKITARAKAYYGSVDLNDPATIETHPLIWTAVLHSPICDDMCEVDPTTVELARRTLKPVSVDEMRSWVASVSEGLPVRWWGGWCLDGELETTFGTGVASYLGEDLPRELVEPSGLAGEDYVTRIGTWSAEVPML